MERRSPPQKRIDDHAFPVRVKVLVPARGFENLLLDMHRWLDAEVGRGSYAVHGAGPGLTQATAWYFRGVEDAQAFAPGSRCSSWLTTPSFQTYQIAASAVRVRRRLERPCVQSVLDAEVAGGDAPVVRRAIDRAGNMPPLPGIYSDYSAPIIRNGPEGRELVMARWGMPTPPQYLGGKRADPGVTNIRRVSSSHWRPGSGPITAA
jgi:hypothetical protein